MLHPVPTFAIGPTVQRSPRAAWGVVRSTTWHAFSALRAPGRAAPQNAGSYFATATPPDLGGRFIDEPKLRTPPLLGARIDVGVNGVPTQSSSLAAVAVELEGLAHTPQGSVELAYSQTSPAETAALAIWIRTSPVDWQYGRWSKFVLWGRNCGNYAREGMANVRGFRAADLPGLSVPNLDFQLYRLFADAWLKPAKATVTTSITSFRLAR
jgi:hypothetical protein